MPPRLSGKGVKSGGPPVFSVEFFIANHADIVSTFCTIVFIGLVFQVSTGALLHTHRMGAWAHSRQVFNHQLCNASI